MQIPTAAMVARPDGRTYRARKPPGAVVLDGDAADLFVCVIVKRTHDVDEARRLAQAALVDEGYMAPDEAAVAVAGCRILTGWYRTVPWCHCGEGHSSHLMQADGNERGSWPGVEVIQ